MPASNRNYIAIALLPAAQQRQALDYARILSITQPQGVKGSSLLAFAGTIPAEELAQMQTAIEADCEHVCVHGAHLDEVNGLSVASW